MNLEHGKKHPWLLTSTQNFLVFAVLFAAKVVLLIFLVRGASKNRDALESIAKSAELAREAEADRTREAEQQLVESPPVERARASSLHISLPEGWKWRGCQASEAGDSVEILLR